MGWTKAQVIIAHAHNSCSHFDLDLQASDMVLASNTSSCNDNYNLKVLKVIMFYFMCFIFSIPFKKRTFSISKVQFNLDCPSANTN